jgi:hypothetical protein
VEQVTWRKYQSLAEAGRRNGIRGAETLVRWIKKYGREYLLPKRIKVETRVEGFSRGWAGVYFTPPPFFALSVIVMAGHFHRVT